ncbi:MAG: FAD-dependent oxidoreductase [Planctomycetota bacterium]
MSKIRINSQEIDAQEGQSVLKSALSAGIYIPHLCSHPDLEPIADSEMSLRDKLLSDLIYQGNNSTLNAPRSTLNDLGCKLCLVEIKGIDGLQKSCGTIVADGMEIVTESERIKQARQENLAKTLTSHPHSCLTCAQSEGCSLTQCSSNVPQNERCCPKFGRCELQKISKYIGIHPSTPRYIPKEIPIIETDPLFKRDYNLCIGCLRCVRACRNLKGIDALGFVINNDQIAVGSHKPSLMDSGCKFCGACVEVCPTGALMDKITVSSDRRKSLVPCSGACPVGMDAPNYIRLIKEGKTDKASEVISHKVPFPGVLGLVCFHPCEENCRRKDISEPISICALKRYATDSVSRSAGQPVGQLTDRQVDRQTGRQAVAVVGGGPAGLTAAYYLAQKGYPVTVFEAEPEIGGMMRYALPEYRLPLSVLKNDLKKITEHPNITIKTNSRLGRDFTIDTLKKDGFKSILLAIGAQSPKKILDKTTAPVLWGIELLKDIRHGKTAPSQFKGKNILVIGGGNVAIDAALSAKRLGAQGVQMACLESRDEMPAHEWEIQQAVDEGIILNCSWGPKGISQSDKDISIDFQQCTSVFDNAGKFNPSFNANVCKTLDADIVIITIGQAPNTEELKDEKTEKQIALNQNGTVKTDENSLLTNIENVFACGEAAHNPASIIESIADGRKAAESIDKFLGGDGVIDKPLDIPKANPYFGRDEKFSRYKRVAMPCLALKERENNFNTVETGLNDKQAKEEAGRCLQCDLRLNISPVIFPPEVSKTGQTKEDLAFTEEHIRQTPDKEGVYILLNENKETILIKGAINIQESLLEQINNSKARFFHYETDPMYTKKESELIQAYLAKHGKLPSGGDELDDLY